MSTDWLYTRGLTTLILSIGLLISVALCTVLYLLLLTVHAPPAYGQPGAPASISAWAADYASWSQRSMSYDLDFRVSILGPLTMAISLAVVMWPKAVAVISFSMLNLFFAWTDWTIANVSMPLAKGLTAMISAQD